MRGVPASRAGGGGFKFLGWESTCVSIVIHCLANERRAPAQRGFFKTEAGNEPVREWLKRLPRDECQCVGVDILKVQYAWPLGKPLVDNLGDGVWEIRSRLGNRIARTLFVVVDEGIVQLHG